jgi:hypothetical protein
LSTESEHLKYRNIELFGQKYFEEYLLRSDSWDIKKLQDNWWEALKFFFSHSFFRGRRDELSNEYYYFTVATLEKHFSIVNEKLDLSYENLKEQTKDFDKEVILQFKTDRTMGRGNSIKREDFRKIKEKNQIIELLTTQRIVKVKWDNEPYETMVSLGNETDVMMVLDCLKFISEDNRKNIYNYLRREIANSGVKKVHDELNGIYGIADKIASFIIRDIMLINSASFSDDEDCKMAFPVDTWVRKIALEKLDCTNKNSGEEIKDEKIKEYLIEKCKKFKVNPLKFAAGLWYLGFNSLDLLLEKLGKLEF